MPPRVALREGNICLETQLTDYVTIARTSSSLKNVTRHKVVWEVFVCASNRTAACLDIASHPC